jgi:hypothetical protein
VWLLMLITETGMMSLQSVHPSPEACEAARETFVKQNSPREKYRPRPYYTVTCVAKETLR